MNWVFISQKTTFFIVTAVKTSNLTLPYVLFFLPLVNDFLEPNYSSSKRGCKRSHLFYCSTPMSTGPVALALSLLVTGTLTAPTVNSVSLLPLLLASVPSHHALTDTILFVQCSWKPSSWTHFVKALQAIQKVIHTTCFRLDGHHQVFENSDLRKNYPSAVFSVILLSVLRGMSVSVTRVVYNNCIYCVLCIQRIYLLFLNVISFRLS
jgi:hypothetical protein